MSSKHIAIPALLKIGPGVLDQLGDYLKELELEKVVILFGNGLIDMFGTSVMESLNLKQKGYSNENIGRTQRDPGSYETQNRTP